MMRLSGRVFKSERFWAIEVPILNVVTQGRTKKEAFLMIADAIESLADRKDFRVEVFPGRGQSFEIGANDQAFLMSFLLKRLRLKKGLSLLEVAEKLGIKSPNAYARYEQGVSVPTVEKLTQLLSAVSPGADFVLRESREPFG
jgi:hypothetical protein